MQQIMHKWRFNVIIGFPVLCNVHRMWPKIMIILCNIAHFLVYIQRLFFILFLVGIMLWYNKDSVNIIYNFYLINLNIYDKMKNSVFSRPRNIHHLQN